MWIWKIENDLACGPLIELETSESNDRLTVQINLPGPGILEVVQRRLKNGDFEITLREVRRHTSITGEPEYRTLRKWRA